MDSSSGVKELSKIINETYESFSDFFVRRRKISFKAVISEIVKTGYEAIPIVAIISLFVGIIMSLQSAYQLKRVGALIYVANLVGISITRELGPILTAILVSGRSGSSFAAEIGSMKISEEIDALTTMGINPVRFLIVPKFLALLLMVPALTLISDFMGILGGWLLAVTVLDINAESYYQQTISAVLLKDISTGLLKSGVFAVIITLTGCYQGFRVSGGAEEVGRRTTASVVASIFLVIVTDCFFTALFYYFT